MHGELHDSNTSYCITIKEIAEGVRFVYFNSKSFDYYRVQHPQEKRTLHSFTFWELFQRFDDAYDLTETFGLSIQTRMVLEITHRTFEGGKKHFHKEHTPLLLSQQNGLETDTKVINLVTEFSEIIGCEDSNVNISRGQKDLLKAPEDSLAQVTDCT